MHLSSYFFNLHVCARRLREALLSRQGGRRVFYFPSVRREDQDPNGVRARAQSATAPNYAGGAETIRAEAGPESRLGAEHVRAGVGDNTDGYRRAGGGGGFYFSFSHQAAKLQFNFLKKMSQLTHIFL